MEINREILYEILYKYFSIGDSYTYELTRVKDAFSYGTASLDDFEEWDSDRISDFCDYIVREFPTYKPQKEGEG